MRPEATLQKHIIAALTQRGAWTVKIHQTGRGRRGIPDIIASYRGYALALEVKPPGATTTEHQRAELRAAHKSGAVATVIQGVHEVHAILNQIDRRHDMAGFPPMGHRVHIGHTLAPVVVPIDPPDLVA